MDYLHITTNMAELSYQYGKNNSSTIAMAQLQISVKYHFQSSWFELKKFKVKNINIFYKSKA